MAAGGRQIGALPGCFANPVFALPLREDCIGFGGMAGQNGRGDPQRLIVFALSSSELAQFFIVLAHRVE